jgi:pimeloyl-ACP methyl ester carboxylesterase
MATYVLVHGGAHGGWCWQRVAPVLRAAGHAVYAPTLTGLGERSHLLGPHVDLAMHIADIVNVLVYEDLRHVILAGHSYGGMVITGVADRALDRVGHLVFLDALQPRDGEAMADLVPVILDIARRTTDDGVELTLLPEERKPSDYGVTDPGDVAWLAGKLTPHPLTCFTQPLHLANEAAVRAIPRSGIYCRTTLGQWPPGQVARAKALERVWEIDTGHDLMVTQPQIVAQTLLRLV